MTHRGPGGPGLSMINPLSITPLRRTYSGSSALMRSAAVAAIISGSAASKPCVDESYAHIAAPGSPSSSATRNSDHWNKCTVSVVAKRRRNDSVAASSDAFRYSQIPRSRCERDAASITHVSSSRSVSVPLEDDRLAFVFVEEHLVLQGPGVSGSHDLHGLRSQALPLVELAGVENHPCDALDLIHRATFDRTSEDGIVLSDDLRASPTANSP